MKRYILLIGIIVMPLSLFSNPSQVTGQLNDLTKALQQLSKRISGGGQVVVSMWEQQRQALEQQMDQIVQSGTAGCNQVGLFYTLSADYTKLIEASGPGAITQYKQNYNKYSLLPYTFEMDCILAGINPLINSNKDVTSLLQDYEAVYGSYTKKVSGLRVLPDQKYPNELKRVRNYVYQYKPTSTGTTTPSSSQVTPPPPPPFSTGTSSTQGTTPPPPPPPMPTGPTKIPTSSQSGSQPAPTTTGSKPTGTRPPLSFLGDIASGTGKLRPTETASGQPKPSQQQGGLFDALKNLIGLGAEQEEEEEGEWEEEGESPELQADKARKAQEVNKRTRSEFALIQDAAKRADINNQRKAVGLIELPAGYQSGEEQQIRDSFDKQTKKDFLNPNINTRTRINSQRKAAGLPELSNSYEQSEEGKQLRKELDKETKRFIIEAIDKYLESSQSDLDLQDQDRVLAIYNDRRKNYGLDPVYLNDYEVEFANFKNKNTTQERGGRKTVHDRTLIEYFLATKLYQPGSAELQKSLSDINQERSANSLAPLKQ